MGQKLKADDRIGKLILVQRRPPGRWLVRCDCGVEKSVGSINLNAGRTRSCGCAMGRRTHGDTGSPEYIAWQAMIARCHDERIPNYRRYGARGIAVCARWRASFEAFLADMGRRPTAEHSLDREDNDSNYEPGNCRWATKLEQAANTRRNVIVEVRGERVCLSEACRRLGISQSAVRARMQRWSCDFTAAIARPFSWHRSASQ